MTKYKAVLPNTHKYQWLFRGSRSKLQCECGLQTKYYPFPHERETMLNDLKEKHRAK